jgi:hypothetical protein
MIVNIGGVQQNFGGDTTDVQAGAAQERIFLNDDGLQSKFACANRGHVATRSAPDNRYIVLCHTPSLFLKRVFPVGLQVAPEPIVSSGVPI